MGFQNGIIGIRGTLGGLVFKADGSIATAPPKRKITAVRTLENNSEFGNAATASKTFRDAFRKVATNITDKVVTSRATKVMRAIIATDAVNDRGQRGVIDSEIELLQGFEFNAGAISTTIMYMGFTPNIARTTGLHNVVVDAFVTGQDLAVPSGTTHVKLVAAASSIDFEMKVSDDVTATSALLPLSQLETPSMTLALPLTPASTHPVAIAFGVEFYQEVNGKSYLLGNGAFSTSRIVAVDGGV